MLGLGHWWEYLLVVVIFAAAIMGVYQAMSRQSVSITSSRPDAVSRSLSASKAFSAVFTFRAIPRAYQNRNSNPGGAR